VHYSATHNTCIQFEVNVPTARTALIFSPLFGNYSYGDEHPFKLQRYHVAQELMEAYGLLRLPGMEIRGCLPVDDDLVLTFHDPAYIARLKEFSASNKPRADFRFGLGDADCPVFQGLYDCAALGAGATFEAARLVEEEDFDIAFNLAGGWHHAHRAKASGFSYLNDAVLAINWLVARGRRVVYLDIDAHHGDGVQEGFYDSDRVLTISLHESGINFFPGTGFEDEIGEGAGKGYSANVPLLAHTDDALYMKAFDEVAYPLIAAYDPDIIVTQIGADTFRTDPLTRLEITTHSYSYIHSLGGDEWCQTLHPPSGDFRQNGHGVGISAPFPAGCDALVGRARAQPGPGRRRKKHCQNQGNGFPRHT
jgi:acetoin utilization protein AcuC